METPNQIAYGLGAFLVAMAVTMLLVKGLLVAIPAVSDYFTPNTGLGVFLLSWWMSYLIIIRTIRRRKERKRPEGR